MQPVLVFPQPPEQGTVFVILQMPGNEALRSQVTCLRSHTCSWWWGLDTFLHTASSATSPHPGRGSLASTPSPT